VTRIFLSVAGPDVGWGDWIYRQLADAGDEVEFYRRSFPVGDAFVASIDAAMAKADRMVAVLSPAYCDQASWVTEEWRAALVIARRKPGYFVPLLVEPCEPPPLLDGRTYVDLVGLPEQVASARLLAALAGRPGVGEEDPHAPFPGDRAPADATGVAGRVRTARRAGQAARPDPSGWPPSRAPTRTNKPTILHLPDLGLARSPAQASPFDGPLRDDLDRLAGSLGSRPDVVAVTGVAASGRASEYSRATALLDGLARHLELGRDRIVIVPGRGDVSAAASRTYFAACEEDEVAPARPYWRKWRQFSEFFQSFYRDTGATFAVGQEWTLFPVAGLRVVVAALNSTMAMSHRVEDDRGEVGDAQARWFADRLESYERDGWFRVAIGHHPPFADAEPPTRDMRDASAVDLVLGRRLNLVITAFGGRPSGQERDVVDLLGRSGTAAVSSRPPHTARPTQAVAGHARRRQDDADARYQLIRADHAGLTRIDRRFNVAAGVWRPDMRSGAALTATREVRWRSAEATFPRPAPRSRSSPYGDDRDDQDDRDDARRRDRGPDEPAAGSGLAGRVAEVARLRHPGARVAVVEPATSGDPAPPPYLRVTVADGPVIEQRPIGVYEGEVDDATLDAFVENVHRSYVATDPHLVSDLVYGGEPAARELVAEAQRRGVRLRSFVEYQGLLDLRDYVRRQSARLLADRLYPPALYLPQRYRLLDGSSEDVHEDLLGRLVDWLTADQARFVLLLGDFGRGKTFLLHELARTLPDRRPHLIPVLVDLRTMEKAHSAVELIATHLVAAGEQRFDAAAFRYMLRSGRLVLLFDGFDELALRVTYETAAEHLGRLLDAVDGQAKIVVTSRTQHFLSHGQVRGALGARVDLLPARRLAEVEDFTEAQIAEFLTRLYEGDEQRARERLELIRDVRDLLGLSRNPRMLGFIARLDSNRLLAARDRAGIISSADLYHELVDQWLRFEEARSAPRGAAPTMRADERRAAVTALARRMWEGSERLITLRDLATTTGAALDAMADRGLDEGQAAHLIGSGSLLVRTAEGGFTFIHQSVMEYLVAADAARHPSEGGGGPDLLGERAMSPLMVDFYRGSAGPARATAWARATLADPGASDPARANALLVAGPLDRTVTRGARLAGASLPGFALGDLDLTDADLRGADLSDARLAGTTLERVRLVGARLTGARLERTSLAAADLTDAEMSGTRLIDCDLTGTTFVGSEWTGAAVFGARRAEDELPAGQIPELAPAAVAGRDGAAATVEAAGWIHGAVFSPTHQVVAYSIGGRVVLASSTTGQIRHVIRGDHGYVRALAFSPDGTRLVYGNDLGEVHQVDTTSLEEVAVVRGGDASVWRLAYSPDGERLAVAFPTGTIGLWSPKEPAALVAFAEYPGGAHSLAFAPDGMQLAAAGRDGTVHIWDAASGTRVRVLADGAGMIRGLAYSPDGRWIASSGNDGIARLWNAVDGRLQSRIGGHAGLVRSLAFSPDGGLLASGGEDGAIRLWDMLAQSPVQVLDDPAGRIISLDFSPSGTHLVSTSDDNMVRIWRLADGVATLAITPPADRVRAVAFSPDGQTLATAGDGRQMRLWDLRTAAATAPLFGHTHWVRSLAFTRRGSQLVSSSSDETIRTWDVATAAEIGRDRSGYFPTVAVSPDGDLLAGTAEDGARAWRADGTRPPTVLAGYDGAMWGIAFSPDGRLIAGGASDGTVRLWDAASLAPVGVLRAHSTDVRTVVFSADGAVLASGAVDGTACTWRVADWAPMARFEGHPGWVRATALSPDGSLVASSGREASVTLWDAKTGNALAALAGHTDWVRSVEFSPDGKLVASASDDGTVRLWDVARCREVATLLGLPAGGWATVFPDGSYKLEGDPAGALWWTMKLCRFEPGELDPYVPGIRRLNREAPVDGLTGRRP
jgi:WD40 repeat protein